MFNPSPPVQYVLKPVFTEAEVSKLDTSSKVSIALDGTKYVPGIVGLNNIKVCGGVQCEGVRV